MGKRTTLDAWTDICHSLFPKRQADHSVHPIHSCIIDGIRHYVHAPELSGSDPSYFQQLVNYAKKHNIVLKADRREIRHEPIPGRRKRLLPIMFLAFGISSANGVFAEHEAPSYNASNELSPTNITLGLMSSKHANTQPSGQVRDSGRSESVFEDLVIDEQLSNRLLSILTAHLETQKDDPASIATDLKQLADYYSAHPEAAKLIQSVAEEEWSLKYAPHTFQTDINGSRINIDTITVYFDPRSGAKLKFYDRCDDKAPFCVASPADALLHEILHVQSVISDTSAFIASGGLSTNLYPAEHEHDTIVKENVLYASMTRRDNHPRPIRSEHSGRHVLVSCVTCVE